MSEPDVSAPLNRRLLLRGAAALGVAGVAAAGSALTPTAEAGTGDPLVLGQLNGATSTTTVATAAGLAPALTLINDAGPSLHLEPVKSSWAGSLAVGDIANTSIGPVLGVDYGDGPETVLLSNNRDLDALPAIYAPIPVRLLDTRPAGTPDAIVRFAANALDSKGRLNAGCWIDVAVAKSGEGMEYSAVYANIAAAGPTKTGYLVGYPPSATRTTSTVNYEARRTVSNSAFLAVEEVDGTYAFRIWSSATTHVVVDITGVMVTVDVSTSSDPTAARFARERRARRAKTLARVHATLGSVKAR